MKNFFKGFTRRGNRDADPQGSKKKDADTVSSALQQQQHKQVNHESTTSSNTSNNDAPTSNPLSSSSSFSSSTPPSHSLHSNSETLEYHRSQLLLPNFLDISLKLAVVGGADVGKTSLIRRYTQNSFFQHGKPTICYDVQSFTLALDDYPIPPMILSSKVSQGLSSLHVQPHTPSSNFGAGGGFGYSASVDPSLTPKVELQIWDVSHREIDGCHQDLILAEVDGIMLVTDWTEVGLAAIDRWLVTIKGLLSHPAHHRRNYPVVPIVLVITKSDTHPDLDPQMIDSYCQQAGIVEWHICSAQSGRGVKDSIEGLLDWMLQFHLDQITTEMLESKRKEDTLQQNKKQYQDISPSFPSSDQLAPVLKVEPLDLFSSLAATATSTVVSTSEQYTQQRDKLQAELTDLYDQIQKSILATSQSYNHETKGQNHATFNPNSSNETIQTYISELLRTMQQEAEYFANELAHIIQTDSDNIPKLLSTFRQRLQENVIDWVTRLKILD